MEQPYAETFVYNAIRKTVDMGQLEFVKSGNRQPVPVTTRYYSRWQKKFIFTETDDNERLRYLLSKVYWLSGVLGEGKPVWIADPRDAQYLNTTEADLLRMAGDEAGEGLMVLSTANLPRPLPRSWPAPPSTRKPSKPRSTSPSPSSTSPCAPATRICSSAIARVLVPSVPCSLGPCPLQRLPAPRAESCACRIHPLAVRAGRHWSNSRWVRRDRSLNRRCAPSAR